jgi:HPt (histidine-containing phosphotransfer) domain-containing protein
VSAPLLDDAHWAQLAADLPAEDLRHVCQLLVRDARAMLAAMRDAESAGDQAAWQRAAHRLAGGAGGVAARPLELLAREMMEQAPGPEALARITTLTEGTIAALEERVG